MVSPSVKIFDLAQAPLEVQEAEEFAALRSVGDDLQNVLLAVVVGEYDFGADPAGAEAETGGITYSEYRLHVWLLENGAERGEPVLLRWSGPVL